MQDKIKKGRSNIKPLKLSEKELKKCSLHYSIKSCIDNLVIPLQVKYPEAFNLCIKLMKEESEKEK
jgi:hypothetical protein